MSILKLDTGWLAARANSVPQSGVKLSTSEFPSSDTPGWMEAVVPGTILTTLLKNNLIPDPFYGMENENIKDIADGGRDYYTFWFCRKFTPPSSGYTLAWLNFRAINYSADVFVNGNKVSLPGGMFRRHKLNITDWINSEKDNHLAVLVHPPDHPGKIPPEGGQGGDHDIAKDVAAQYVEGWDWIIPIRDRNTGLWDEVSVSFTGPVTIRDPHLVTTFYDHFTRAYLDVSTELINSTSKDVLCTVQIQVSLDGEDNLTLVEHVYSGQISVKAGAIVNYNFPQFLFYKPKLWWPNGMGKQPLYRVDISVGIGDNESDTWSHRLGFRHIESHIDSSTKGRAFRVNGQPLFIRGGNWIVSDGLLRLSEKRYKTDVGFHADMNMNMIRIWAGALAERPAFYDACDERGLLVWQEFWITGDCNGRGVAPSERSWPLDHELFLLCARDTVKLLRNHASLALWVGGNEQIPAEDINAELAKDLALNPAYNSSFRTLAEKGQWKQNNTGVDVTSYLDGTRLYVPGSLWSGFADGNGDWGDGPYQIQNPQDFFAEDFYPYAFNPELGSVGVPNAATIRATMPPEAWDPPAIREADKDGYVVEVPNPTWDYHKYIAYSDADTEVRHQIAAYGKPKDLDDFCTKAQLVNYDQYRALIESWNSRMWTKYTGVLIWKTQNPWPGLRGGLYDFLLDQTGGFFGVKSAAEPVHVQLNLATKVVEIVNTTGELLEDGSVEVSIWKPDSATPHQVTHEQLSSPPFQTVKGPKVSYENSAPTDNLYFVLLKLFQKSGTLVSRNFYWLHKPGNDYSLMDGEFKTQKVPVRVSAEASQDGDIVRVAAEVKNVSDEGSLMGNQSLQGSRSGVAFWMRFCVLRGSKGGTERDDRILPVTYSNNYFSLVPGETERVTISFAVGDNVVPKVLLQGWNIDDVHVPCQLRRENVQPQQQAPGFLSGLFENLST